MLAESIGLGTKLELELIAVNGEIIRPALLSQFEAEVEEGVLIVLMPIRNGIYMPLNRGTEMNVIYETKGELCSFRATVLDRAREGNVHMLRLRALTEIKRIHRRTFYRFETVRDVRYRVFDSLKDDEIMRGSYVKGITKDISGGGLCILMQDKPELGAFVEGMLTLDEEMAFTGRVVRIIAVQSTGVFRYEIGVMFTELDNRSQNRIIRFIFELQRSLLKKGWSK